MILGPLDDVLRAPCSAGPDTSLEAAQAAKYELVSRKLGLRPGMRLPRRGLRAGGGMVMHAAREHGVSAVGVTFVDPDRRSGPRAAVRRGRSRGPGSRSECRTTATSPTAPSTRSAPSACFEHVRRGEARRVLHPALRALLSPGGRLLNHGHRPPSGPAPPRFAAAGLHRQVRVSPTASCTRVGSVVSRIQKAGFEGSPRRRVCASTTHKTLRRWVREPGSALGRSRRARRPWGRARVLASLHGRRPAAQLSTRSARTSSQVLAVKDRAGRAAATMPWRSLTGTAPA